MVSRALKMSTRRMIVVPPRALSWAAPCAARTIIHVFDLMTHSDAPSSIPSAWTATELQSNPHEAADKADRVRRMFAAIAGRYDLNNRLHSFGRDQAWRRKAVALCEIQPSDDVLDVACGTGDLTTAFAAEAPRTVTGLD